MPNELEVVDNFFVSFRKSVLEDNILVENSTTNNLLSSDAMNDGILIPKDSIEILNELKPGIVITTEQLELSKKVTATVKINENTYLEYGKTESQARQAVAESVLKDLFFETIKSTIFNEDDCQYNTNSWRLLGSLAMFKLIEEWLKFYMSNIKYKNAFDISMPPKINDSSNNLLSQKQNAKVSKNDHTLKHQESSLKSVNEVTIPKMKQQSVVNKTEIIDNKKKHPLLANKKLTNDSNACTILNLLVKPNIKFVDLSPNKNQPPFTVSVTVDGVEYISNASRSKKEAKQDVSKKVLIKKFGYSYQCF